MRYFLLSQSDSLVKPIVIDGLDPQYYKYNITEKDWERIPDMIVAYFQNSMECEVSAVLKQPTLMIDNEMKQLFELYDSKLDFKGIQIFSNKIEDRLGYLYWVVKCPEAECLHETSKVYANGMLEEIVLDRTKLPDRPVFKIASVMQNTMIVNLPVAESILRRNWLGIGLKEVAVR